MTARPTDLGPRPRAHEMGIYKRYFDLIAAGVKTTEIRVNDSSRQKIVEGSLIRFRCRDDEVLTRVTQITHYPSFDDMFDHESVTSINPTATRGEQLANIRQIYPPEREALGVVAIGIELVDPPRPQETTAGARGTAEATNRSRRSHPVRVARRGAASEAAAPGATAGARPPGHCPPAGP